MGDAMMMFREGGWAMYAVMAIGIPAWFFTLIAGGVIMFKRKPFPLILAGVFTALCGLMTILLGAVGYFNGMSIAEEVIMMSDPQQHATIMAEAKRVAAYPLYFGLFLGTIPALVGGACLVLALTLRKSGETTAR